MDNSKTYLALGDSYTIGELVDENECFPAQLVKRLNEKGLNYAHPDIIATTGWTTDELKEGISKAKLKEEYNLVSLLIGVNNQYRGYDIDIYKKEFRELLETAIKFAGGNKWNVFVVSIPDYGVTPFAKEKNPNKIAKEIDLYNQINKEITRSYGVKYFDITPLSRKAKNDADFVASDSLHPSGKMYKLWVDEVIFPKFFEK